MPAPTANSVSTASPIATNSVAVGVQFRGVALAVQQCTPSLRPAPLDPGHVAPPSFCQVPTTLPTVSRTRRAAAGSRSGPRELSVAALAAVPQPLERQDLQDLLHHDVLLTGCRTTHPRDRRTTRANAPTAPRLLPLSPVASISPAAVSLLVAEEVGEPVADARPGLDLEPQAAVLAGGAGLDLAGFQVSPCLS